MLPEIRDLAHLISVVLAPLKEAVQRCQFAGDKLNHGLCEVLRSFSKEFCVSGIQHLLQGWESSVLVMKEVSWKNKLQSVKDVPKVRANLIIIVIVVPLKKKGITFCTALLSR